MMAILVLSLGLSCAKEKEEVTVEPVKIGLVQHLSGPYGAIGKLGVEGTQIAVDVINAAGGIESLDGAKLELIVADDKGDPALAKTEMERLINEEHVVAMFTGIYGAVQQATAPLSDKYKVPFIAEAFYDPYVARLGLSYWHAVGTGQDDLMASYLNLLDVLIGFYHIKCNSIVSLTYDSTGPRYGNTVLLNELEKRGLNVVGSYIHPVAVTSLDSYVLKIRDDNPDVLFQAGTTYHTILLLKSFAALGYQPPIIIAGTTTMSEVWNGLSEEERMETIAQPAGVFGYGGVPLAEEYIASVKAWAEECRAAGFEPQTSHTYASQAVYILKRALEATGSRDPVVINQALKEVVIREGDPDFVSEYLAPEFAFTDNGTPKHVTLPWGQRDEEGVIHRINPFTYGEYDPRLPQ
jgi:branched-chain amino acid transport system substrate-binding protein